jgi:hypothetical protein
MFFEGITLISPSLIKIDVSGPFKNFPLFLHNPSARVLPGEEKNEDFSGHICGFLPIVTLK